MGDCERRLMVRHRWCCQGVPLLRSQGISQLQRVYVQMLSLVVVVGVLAGCHHGGGDSAHSTSASGSATGAGASQSPDDLPLWEQPELLAKYPVRAKKNPDGSYDYSDPKFENADLCKDLPPHYWEKRGYETKGTNYVHSSTVKDCWIDDSNQDLSKGGTIGTDKRERKHVAGKLFKQYSPGRFDQVVMNMWPLLCTAYIETPIGRIGASYGSEDDKISEAQLCERAREILGKVSK